MKRMAYLCLAMFALLLGLTAAAQAQTPNPNGALLNLRYFNDCPISTLTSGVTYPSVIWVQDVDPFACVNGANKHLWKFSDDGGATKSTFHNNSNYSFCADVLLSGTDTADIEAGLNLSPWWSDGDGQYMINGGTGEIAIFGGRLPFFSFTTGFGLHYAIGTTAHMAMTYNSGAVDPTISGLPAHVTYDIIIAGTPYSSGPLPFDQGTIAENPPHGLWGELDPASAGGYVQAGHNGTTTSVYASWSNICYSNNQSTPTRQSTWGALKTLYR